MLCVLLVIQNLEADLLFAIFAFLPENVVKLQLKVKRKTYRYCVLKNI